MRSHFTENVGSNKHLCWLNDSRAQKAHAAPLSLTHSTTSELEVFEQTQNCVIIAIFPRLIYKNMWRRLPAGSNNSHRNKFEKFLFSILFLFLFLILASAGALDTRPLALYKLQALRAKKIAYNDSNIAQTFQILSLSHSVYAFSPNKLFNLLQFYSYSTNLTSITFAALIYIHYKHLNMHVQYVTKYCVLCNVLCTYNTFYLHYTNKLLLFRTLRSNNTTRVSNFREAFLRQKLRKTGSFVDEKLRGDCFAKLSKGGGLTLRKANIRVVYSMLWKAAKRWISTKDRTRKTSLKRLS